MSCIDRFTITKEIDNEFILTIKQTGTTLPMEILQGDTFVTTLVALDGSTTLQVATTILDTLNGKIQLSISSVEASALVSKKGDAVDLYYTLPTYKLIIDCNTVNNGKFIAKIPFVYVD